jgi:hypothetical protein
LHEFASGASPSFAAEPLRPGDMLTNIEKPS